MPFWVFSPHWNIVIPDFSLLFAHIFTLASNFRCHQGVNNLKKFVGREAILWGSKVYVILVKGHLRASPGASSQKPQNQGPAPYYKMPQVKFLSSSYYTGSGQKKTKMLQKEKEWWESQRQTRKTILDRRCQRCCKKRQNGKKANAKPGKGSWTARRWSSPWSRPQVSVNDVDAKTPSVQLLSSASNWQIMMQ